MLSLEGKVAVVTGAGRGIGRRLAVRLASLGAATALIARSDAQLREVADIITDRGGKALILPADVSRPDAIDALKQSVGRELGQPSILINAAGVFGPIQLVRNTDPEAWIETLMINTVGAYLTCRAFVGEMLDSGWGRIINVTSAAALHDPGPINSAYGTSKAALNHFTRHLAAEIEGSGVTANVIHPGDVRTDMWGDIRDRAANLGPEAARYQDWAAWVDRTGGDDPEKASDLIVDLLDEAADSVNGRFLWIEDGLQNPIPSWGDFPGDDSWRRKPVGQNA